VVSRGQIQINGVPVSIHGSYEREVQNDAGQAVAEMEVVIIVRGRLPNKQFMQLLNQEQVRLDFEDGSTQVTMMTRVANHSAVASGSGEYTVYRHDIQFQEFPDSFQRRQAERAAAAPAVEAPRRVSRPAVVEEEQVEEIAEVMAASGIAAWGDAIKQLKHPAPRPQVQEEPLTLPEMSAIETVLTNLRIDALVQLLEGTGMIPSGAVEATFRDLLRERFVAEATPLVGVQVAERAAREIQPE
jgi:hypothetical protein